MAALTFHHGAMSSGKTTLALQLDHTLRAQGQRGLVLVTGDRSGQAAITSRLGLSAAAVDVAGVDPFDVAKRRHASGGLDYVIVDEAQFLEAWQVDRLADVADDLGVPVSAFGLLTTFAGECFPGSLRLVEVADDIKPLPVRPLCWCGTPAIRNARVVDGVVVHEGATVVIGDTDRDSDVYYVPLCRRHWRDRAPDAAPTAASA